LWEATIDQGTHFRPPAPLPRARRAGPVALVRALWNSPIEAWTQAHFEEPVVTHSLPFGKAVIVNDPAGIEHVLLRNAANYRKDTLQRRIISGSLSNGLLTSEGEQWRIQRRTLAPLFSRRTIQGFAAPMAQVADEFVARWRRTRDGESFDMAAEMTRLTLEVLERTIFSDGLGHSIEQFRAAMRDYFDTIGRIDPFDVLGLPDAIPRLTRLWARGALRFFDEAVDTIIANRRKRLAAAPGEGTRDILTLLLEALDPDTGRGLSEVEVKSNIITFIAAGHETTANALAWSLYLLSQSPEWSERVAAEAAREMQGGLNDPLDGAADRMVETRAVIEEAMRLYPPLAAISREAVGADEIAGVPVAPRCTIVIAPYLLHRHRRLWERADLFDPSRFLPGARDAIGRYAYLPFGAGPRICIGAAFALQEATLVLGTVLRNFRIAMAPGAEVWPLQRLTLRPRGGLPMVLTARESDLARAKSDAAAATVDAE
jgi:cytochrome P450